MLLSKSDLLEYLDDFQPQRAEQSLRQLASHAPVIRTCAGRQPQIDSWLNWLREEVEVHKNRLARGESLRPAIQPDGVRWHSSQENPNHIHP